ncbi:MAG: methyltransferase regulatory domain-containing protein [Granulosicoccus sp.]
MISAYPVDSAYVPVIVQSMAPAIIDHVVRTAGLCTPRHDTSGPFRYIDLGCGYGLTLLCFAAAYPDAQFVGVDANAGHIAKARSLADEAGLNNIELICDVFNASAVCQLPPADYVTSHGVFSWVDSDVQNQLMAAKDRLLKPEGAMLISANTLVGWTDLPLVQRVFSDIRLSSPDTSLPELYRRAINQLQTLSKIAKNPRLREAMNDLQRIIDECDDQYIMHEFFSSAWQPVWTSDLIRRCEPLGLAYCGRADLRLLRDDLAHTRAQRTALADAVSPIEAETFRDLFLALPHSQFVFSRSQTATQTQATTCQSSWFTLNVPRAEAVFEVRTPAGRLVFDTPLCRRLLDRLAAGTASANSLIDSGQPDSAEDVRDTLDALLVSRQVVPSDPPLEVSGAVEALNDVLARHGFHTGKQAAIGGTPLKV